MPRAAMSVATMTFTFPDLKSPKALWRCPCDLFPWIASLRMPALFSMRAMLSAPCFVREKTSTDLSACFLSTDTSKLFFSGLSTK